MHIVCPHCLAINNVPEERLSQHPNCGKCKQVLFTGKPVDVSDGTFSKWINKSDVPIIVDCWAAWCGPCKMFGPIFSDATTTLEPKYRLLKLDTEANQQTAAQLGIRSIPTIIAFHRGKEINRLSGALPAAQFLQWVRQLPLN